MDAVTPDKYRFDRALDTITFSGIGRGGPFDRMTLSSVTVRVVSGELQLVIVGSGPERWSLTDAFPDIRSPIITQLSFHEPTLSWSSYEDDTADLAECFYLVATVDFDEAPLSIVGQLLPGLQEVGNLGTDHDAGIDDAGRR